MKFYVSKLRTVGLFLLAVLMTGVSAFCTQVSNFEAHIAGWAGVLFCGFGMAVIFLQLFRSGEQVVIDESGLSGRRLGVTLSWSEIEGVWIGWVNSSKFLCIDLKQPEKYLSALSKTKRTLANANISMGFAPLTVSFSGLIPGFDEAWRYLRLNHAEKVLEKNLALKISAH